MNIPYALRRLLAAAVCLAAVQPAAAADLSGSSFVRQAADRASYEPGGKYSLFGSRGSITQRDGQITVSPTFTQQIGNLEFSRATINGNIGYTISFSGHGYEVHAPFDNYASRTASDRQGSIVSGGAASYSLNWTGHENHPADGYDGPQGGGYPAPAGARDIYSYTVNGTALSTRLNLTDTRTTGQHFADRFKNAGDMLTSGIGGSWRQATETNPNLNRWGNAADTVNGLVGMAGNVIGAAGEVIGVGDAVQGIGAGIDIATAAALDAASSAEADIRFADTAMGAEGAKDAVVRSIQGFADANPNAAEGMKAVVNMATAGYGAVRGVGAVRNGYDVGGLDAGSYRLKQMGAVAVPNKQSYSGTSEAIEPYKRPNNATTKAQRKSVQGQPCVDCGGYSNKMYADHKKPLVVEYYETGSIDRNNMRSLEAVQPHCPTCSSKQGGKLSQYSKEQRRKSTHGN